MQLSDRWAQKGRQLSLPAFGESRGIQRWKALAADFRAEFVSEGRTFWGEGNEDAAAVVRVLAALGQPHLLQAVRHRGDGGGGDADFVGEVAERQAVPLGPGGDRELEDRLVGAHRDLSGSESAEQVVESFNHGG